MFPDAKTIYSPQAFGLWHSELSFVEEMIDRDVRNNSAWNQRFFVLSWMLEVGAASSSPATSSSYMGGVEGDLTAREASGGGSVTAVATPVGDQPGGEPGGGVTSRLISRRSVEEVLGRELQYVANKISLAPRNESCWNYLLGLFSSLPGCRRNELAHWPQVHTVCIDALAKAPSSPPALAVLVRIS